MASGVYTHKRRSIEDRFWEKVDKNAPNGCWFWTADLRRGYGYINLGGRREGTISAHRFSYQLVYGAIPVGLEMDHLCRTRNCVNPAHLEIVTGRENTLRGSGPTSANAQKTHCSQGHPYDLLNTYFIPKGGRQCRACNRVRDRAYKARRKAGHR